MYESYDGRQRQGINEAAFNQGTELVYVNAFSMPRTPIKGTTEIILACTPGNYFGDEEGHYHGIPVRRIVWNSNGTVHIIREEKSIDVLCRG